MNKLYRLICIIAGSPPGRVIILGCILITMMGLNTDVMTSYAGEPIKAVFHVLALDISGFAIYISYVHFIEQRSVSELAVHGMARQVGLGLLIGVCLYTTSEIVLILLGIYRIVGLNPWSNMIPAAAMALSSSVYEELLFRGLLYGAIEQWCGSWFALFFSSLVFGLTHLLNLHGTLEGALFIAFEAGILLTAAYMLTRKLWLSIGFHMAWNYTQSAIFSSTVSGNGAQQGLINCTIHGPDWLTGGSFGMESSVIALLLCTTTGLVMLNMAIKRKKIVVPIWRR